MKYYFKMSSSKDLRKISIEENFLKQTVLITLFEHDSEEEKKVRMLDSKEFHVNEIFVSNFYGLIPVKGNKILDMINMEEHRGQIGAVEKLKRIFSFDDYLCGIVSGNEPQLESLSVIGFTDFEMKNIKIENEDNSMSFSDALLMSVENQEKVLVDIQKRKLLTSIAPNESLSGLEAQVDLLSQIVVSLVAELKPEVPEIYKKICNETPIEEFEEVLAKVSTGTLKNAKELLTEMEKQKGKIRENQKRYFEQRQQVRADLSECGN